MEWNMRMNQEEGGQNNKKKRNDTDTWRRKKKREKTRVFSLFYKNRSPRSIGRKKAPSGNPRGRERKA